MLSKSLGIFQQKHGRSCSHWCEAFCAEVLSTMPLIYYIQYIIYMYIIYKNKIIIIITIITIIIIDIYIYRWAPGISNIFAFCAAFLKGESCRHILDTHEGTEILVAPVLLLFIVLR